MFTPVETTLGALLLQQSTSLLLHNNGLVLGCSGFVRNLFSASPSSTTLTFLLGMASSVPVLQIFFPSLLTSYPPAPSSLEAALVTMGVGALVGWGTKAGNGCTSGHMLCGLSRLSVRSAVAVGLFFPAAILTHHLVHPSLLTQECLGDVPCYTPVYPSNDMAVSLVAFTGAMILIGRWVPRFVAGLTASPASSSSATPRATEQQRQDTDKTTTSPLPNKTTAFISGLEFALGLQISQMSSPAKVSSFLSFPSLDVWDPSLALILVFAVLPNYLDNRFRGHPYRDDPSSKTAPSPTFATHYQVPRKTLQDVNWKFMVGAVAFGCGWGLTGTCPGPAVIRSVMQPQWGLLWMSGFWLGGLL
ncbi:hypothetical protein DM02DRAFT_439034 [Periconia macrospinosa]|uniref:YeeE/YedE family integral membrane protein n=1 Tax=Periconia macrospinosa TaxID=97972 RepID=A0A2V1DN33_9PLEO|nr:hypothetical protein DM02DRAFT_439034 [Periconia macrospinosa]